MSSSELAVNGEAALEGAVMRRAALERLNWDAENASTPEDAREIMVKGKLAADLIKKARAPFEDARLAGKASVTAARRLGRMLADLPSSPQPILRSNGRACFAGRVPSVRTSLARELGMSKQQTRDVLLLAASPDPEFQRYIQMMDRIPSVNGALRAMRPGVSTYSGGPQITRRKRANVKVPANPSLDEGYSLIVKSLGHLTSCVTRVGKNSSRRDVGLAIQHLYAAEDLLKPYRAGYGD